MRAVDTNVIVRLILLEDAPQTELATAAIVQDVFVPITVLLETAWVLSSTYKLDRHRLAMALAAVLDIETIHVDDEEAVRWALDRYAAGADIADMLHIVAAGNATHFATFDRGIARHAGPDAPVVIETLGAA